MPRLAAAMITVLLAVTPLVVGSLAGAAPSVFGGFEVDGNLSAAAATDWSNAAPLATIVDPVQGAGDNGFKGGSKEQEPDSWVYGTDNNPPNKDDLVRGYVSQSLVSGELFLFTSFRRTSANGDVHIDFEFNQDGTFLNPNGFDVPARRPGDLLVTYDGNNADLDIRAWRWSGDEHSGTWDLLPSTAGIHWDADLNDADVSDPLDGGANSAAGTFGEASLNLTRLGINLSCPGFGMAWMKTRSSQSITAELKDRTDQVPVDLSNCGDITVHKVDDATPPNPLAGAVFGLFATAASPTPLQTATTGANGAATFTQVTPGNYFVKEISAPAGYSASTAVVPVTVGIRQSVDVPVPFVNPRHTGAIRITKRAGSATGPLVSGVRFVILQNGTQARKWPSGAPAECVTVAGTCTVDKLLLGTYTVHEDPSTVPSSQFPAPDQDVTITSNAQTVSVTFVNPLKPLAITVQKTATPVVHVGDVIAYGISVRNPSAIPMTVAIRDDECTGIAGPQGDNGDGVLAPNNAETWTYSCTHVATSADGREYLNHVEATGTDEFGRRVSAQAQASTQIIHPAITIDKKVAGADHKPSANALLAHAGDNLDYTVVVTNTGDTPLTISGLQDSLHANLAASCDRGNGSVLAPGARINCSYNDPATADAHNVASVVGTDQLGGPKGTVTASDETFVDVINPAIAIVKTADPVLIHAGDGVTYTYVVTNTGNTGLSNVSVTDDKLGAVGGGFSLAPGASRTFTKATTLQAGTTNIATASGADALGRTVSASDDAQVDVITPNISIVKTADPVLVHAGDRVTYTYVVTNTGTTSLAGVNVTDDKLGGVGGLPTLAAGAVQTFTKTANVSVDTTNVATASGTDALGRTVSASDDAHVDVIAPSIGIVKTADPVTIHSGDTVKYTYVVTNNGDTALSAVTVTDDKLGAIGGPVTLATGASQSFTKSAPIGDDTTNVASTSGTDVLGKTVTASDDAKVDVIHPAVDIVKTVSPELVHPGDKVDYTYVVRNTGDVGLTAVTVTDDRLGAIGTVTGTLAAGASTTLRREGVVITSQTTNIGTVTGTDPLGLKVTDSDDARVDVIDPAITLEKTGPALAHEGDKITYTFKARNTGDTPLTQVVITDPTLGVTLQVPPLVVGGEATLTAQHTVAVAGPDPLTNNAEVCGVDALNKKVCASDTHIVDIIHPAITVTKVADPTTVSPGGQVTYTYVAKNTGDTPLLGVTLVDDVIGEIGKVESLAVGASQTFTKTVTIQATTPPTNIVDACGADALGARVCAQAQATITQVLGARIELPRTGAQAARLAGLGFFLVALGLQMAWIRRLVPARGR